MKAPTCKVSTPAGPGEPAGWAVAALLREVRWLESLHHIVRIGDQLSVLPAGPAVVGGRQRLVLGRGEWFVVGLHDAFDRRLKVIERLAHLRPLGAARLLDRSSRNHECVIAMRREAEGALGSHLWSQT